MSGFGKFIGLLAVGAIGFVVYSCIVYDPDAASSDVKSNDTSSASEMNAEAADKNFNIVGDWLWEGEKGSSYFSLDWLGNAEIYGVTDFDVKWKYDDNKLTFTYYYKDKEWYENYYASFTYDIEVVDNDTILFSANGGRKYEFIRKSLDEAFGEKIGEMLGDLFG